MANIPKDTDFSGSLGAPVLTLLYFQSSPDQTAMDAYLLFFVHFGSESQGSNYDTLEYPLSYL